jgi:hypothetical protein
MVVGRHTGDGEQTSIEVIANSAELPKHAKLAYDIIDSRMFLQNERVQSAMKLMDDLPIDLRMKVQRCHEVTFGIVSAEDIIPPEAYQLKRVPNTAAEEPEGGQDPQVQE